MIPIVFGNHFLLLMCKLFEDGRFVVRVASIGAQRWIDRHRRRNIATAAATSTATIASATATITTSTVATMTTAATSATIAGLVQLYLWANQKTDRAVGLAEEAVKAEPIALNYFLLARSYQRQGELSKAQAAMQKAVELEPDNTTYQQAQRSLGSRE